MVSKQSVFIMLSTALLFLSIFLAMRLLNLTYLPYFGDEAEYIWYAREALNDPSERFISLEVGKQPLFVWIVMGYLKIFSDPMIAGRLASVGAGILTTIGIWLLSFALFRNKAVAWIASLFFIFYPFAQLLNRIGNYDSTVGMFYIWSLFFTVLLVQKMRLDIAYTLGFVLGGGILTKTNAFFSIYLLPFSLLLFDHTKRMRNIRVGKLLVLLLVSVVIAHICYLILQLSPLYERILWFNGAFVYPKREWLTLSIPFRIELFLTNMKTMIPFFYYYLTPAYLVLIVLSFFTKKRWKERVLLFVYFFLPVFALGIFGREIASRWIYPFTLPLLPIAAFGWVRTVRRLEQTFSVKKRELIFVAGLVLVLLFPALQTILISTKPLKAHIPPVDRQNYFVGVTWDIRDLVVPYLKKESGNREVFVGVQGLKGNPQAIELYSYPEYNLRTKGYLLWEETYNDDIHDMIQESSSVSAYFVGHGLNKPHPNIQLVKELLPQKSHESRELIPIWAIKSF